MSTETPDETPEPTPKTYDDALTLALLTAIEGAEECRNSDEIGHQRVCGPCWDAVIRAADAVSPPPPITVS